MGLWKGKKGSSVFYQIKNSNSLQKQGVRERNYEPANPKSARQAGQRMRMYPAQAVYGVLKDTIERSWQGVKYGQMTRQAYLKAALRSEFFPAVSKGDGVIVPGPYQIAKGTLQEVPVTVKEGYVDFGFLYANPLSVFTVGELSKQLIEGNPWLQVGDQITIVLCYTNDPTVVQFNWNVGSFYINLEDETELTWEHCDFIPMPFELSWDANGISIQPRDDAYLYAASCIVSREGSTPLRSNSFLAVDTAALPNFYGATARAKAQRSYMKALTVQSTDWPVDPDTEGGGSSTETYTVSQVTQDEQGHESAIVGGTVSGGGAYLPGETVWLVASPAAQYDFIGWYPSKADALAGSNRISNAANFGFTAGDSSVVTSNTIVGLFRHEL